MTKAYLRILVLTFGALFVTTASASSADDNRSWDFTVLLDGSQIGFHRFEVDKNGEVHEVTSEASFNVRFLFFTAFRYRHTNREVWDDGCLARIESSTRQNGERVTVSGALVDDSFRLEAGERVRTLDDCVMTFAYWNPEFLEQQQLLNPQTGEYLPVEVETLGTRKIDVRGEQVSATEYRLKAEQVELTLWYSEDQEWLGLESVARGGRILRYELT